MKVPLVIDFDGTLFNTLPVHYRFKKERLHRDEDKVRCHLQFITKNRERLEDYSKEWSCFLSKAQAGFSMSLISETSYEEMMLYLEAFRLGAYFSAIFGQQFAKDGTRERKIEELIVCSKRAYLISDNPSDLALRKDSLEIRSSQNLYLDGFDVFCQRLNEMYLSLEKTTSVL